VVRQNRDRDPEVSEQVAPAQIEALGKWSAPRANPYDYLRAITQLTLVINGDNDGIIYASNSLIQPGQIKLIDKNMSVRTGSRHRVSVDLACT